MFYKDFFSVCSTLRILNTERMLNIVQKIIKDRGSKSFFSNKKPDKGKDHFQKHFKNNCDQNDALSDWQTSFFSPLLKYIRVKKSNCRKTEC